MSKSVYMDLVERNLKLKKEIVEMLKEVARFNDLNERSAAIPDFFTQHYAEGVDHPDTNLYPQMVDANLRTIAVQTFSAQENQAEVEEKVQIVEGIIKELKN